MQAGLWGYALERNASRVIYGLYVASLVIIGNEITEFSIIRLIPPKDQRPEFYLLLSRACLGASWTGSSHKNKKLLGAGVGEESGRRKKVTLGTWLLSWERP